MALCPLSRQPGGALGTTQTREEELGVKLRFRGLSAGVKSVQE